VQQEDRRVASRSDDGGSRRPVDAVADPAIYLLDPAGVVTGWNPGAERFDDDLAGGIGGRHVSRFYTEEDRASGLPGRALLTAEREGRFAHEAWRVREDGSRYWAHVVVDPIRLPTGGLAGFVMITHDLTERRAAEEILRQGREQFRLLVQGVTDYAIYLLDRDGRVSSWNPGAQRIKGYAQDEILGSHFSRFYTEADRAVGLPARALATAALEGRFEAEGWRVRKDGSRFWANVVIDPVRDDRGELVGFAKITRDITERREAQVKLEKTREVLLQSQKLEAIGQLTGGIAHDFNNLLMAVIGSLKLMRKRLPEDPRLLALLDNALQGAERGATLTQRMLAFARRQDLSYRPVDIPDLVRGMRDLLQRSMGPSVRIETRFPLAGRRALADANQLEMALLNLCLNARDAMPDGGAIVVSSREENVPAGSGAVLKPGDYLCLRVVDTGEGMDEATCRRATEPFFTTKGPGQGTGLGLSMVHGIAEQSGGAFTLTSSLGAGTTAEIWLPAVTAPPDPGLEETPGPAAQAGQQALTVLAVDDDALVLTNTVDMLEELGHRALSAGSGHEALEILRRGEHVDLVVTDQAMPRMTGLQLAEEIARTWPDLPVILATGYAELPAGSEKRCLKLAKPFDEQHLAAGIRRVLGSRAGARG